VKKTAIYSILILLLQTMQINAQCSYKNNAFRAGEILSYKAYYNWGFIWLEAGGAEFSVKETNYNGKSAFQYEINGYSHEGYDWVLRVRDYLTSIADKETLLPYVHRRDSKEGDYRSENYYTFDYQKKKVFVKTYNTDDGKLDTVLKLSPCLFDLVSAVYHVRTIPFVGKKIGDTIPINSIVDGEIYRLFIRYQGKEKITVEDTENTYNCIKFSVYLIEGTMFNEGENMMVWVSDDANRIPIKVEAKILVGSVQAYISDIKGAQNPITSRISK